MTAPVIAPVIPSPGRQAGAPRVRPGAVRPLSMAGPAAALAVPEDVVYGTGRIDASGRVTDQAVSCALGWCEGDRLTLTASPGVVTARREAWAGRAGDAWLEECRQAGAGEFQLTLGYRTAAAPPAKHESTADFLTRLARERAEAERRQAAGELTDSESEPAAKTMSLADEMRAMGLM